MDIKRLEGIIEHNESIPRTLGGDNHNMSFTDLVRAFINTEPNKLQDYFKTDVFVGA